MTELPETAPDHYPKGISRNPLYKPLCAVYWIFVGAVITKIIGAFIGFWEYPVLWMYLAAFTPALVLFFYSLLQDMIADVVYEGTKRALEEMLEYIDDSLPEEFDEEKIAALYNSEPAGRA